MSTPFAISIGVPSLSWTSDGTVAGQVVVWLDGHAFPDASWWDFPVPVLEWWCRGCLALLDGAGSTRLHLMDGPYSLDVHAEPARGWRVRAMRDGDPMPATPHEPVPLMPAPTLAADDVLRSVVAAAGTVLDTCEERGWTSDDVVALRSARDELRRRAG